MMPKEELLQYIHKTADMGVSGLEDVLPKTEDQELFSTLEKQKTQYEKVRQEARRLLERQGESVNDASAMAKLSANMMSAGKLLFDASPEKIAEMTEMPTIPESASSMTFSSVIPPMATTGIETALQIARSASMLTSEASAFEPVGNTAPTPR